MITRSDYLLILNSKNKVQVIKLWIDADISNSIYTIHRVSSQFGGKEINQPELVITSGKVHRTAAEQAALQYNSLLKNYLDKGYKKYPNTTIPTLEEAKTFLGNSCVSDQFGIPKPMLAKLADQCSSNIWNKTWIVSRKLDGARCLMYYKDGEIHTSSRGGGTYDIATTHLRTNPELLKIFSEKPNLILDGEIYHHGTDWPLQRISGLARLQQWSDECNNLEYWIYDYISNEPFKERLDYHESLKDKFTNSPIKILEQIPLSGYLNIKKEHDKYVQEGFEGLCARNPNREYGINKRSALYLIKLKERKDAEATIIDIKEGLRAEDMCFILKMPSGLTFAAKPIGEASTRIDYLKNKDNYIGKQMTYTYFTLSKDGIPTQPVAKHIRPDDE